MARPRAVGIFGLAITIAACVSTSRDETSSSRSALARPLPCDVDAVLAKNCQNCHGAEPSFGAPMPLVTHDDLLKPAVSNPSKKVYELVQKRVHADVRPMPPTPNPRLSQTELATLDGWINQGVNAGSTQCSSPDAGTDPDPTMTCTPDMHMSPASAWQMPETSDDVYVCYGFDVTSEQKKHVIGIAPRIDDRTIVHHLLLFQADRSVSSTPQPCSSGLPLDWRIVYGWAPGGTSFELPPEAGFPQEQTTHYVVQIHYNNVLHAAGHRDASGFDFCTTSQLRPNDADTMVFGTTRINIPPRSTQDVTCDAKMPANFPNVHLFAAFPHMHQLGTAITTKKTTGEDLGAQASWDFQNQVYFPINSTLRAGETVRTRCAWKNDTDRTVTFGEATEDEMCFSFTMYWPKLTSLGTWGWMTPVGQASCRPTPTP